MTFPDRRTSAHPQRRRTVVALSPPLCRRCVRLVSRCLRDVTGVASWQVDPGSGQVSVHGDVEPDVLVRALTLAGWRVTAPPP
jgi:copper chaperone CopZ